MTCAADDPGLGCPVEYIDLRGTTREKPAVCKYTGNKYWCVRHCSIILILWGLGFGIVCSALIAYTQTTAPSYCDLCQWLHWREHPVHAGVRRAVSRFALSRDAG